MRLSFAVLALLGLCSQAYRFTVVLEAKKPVGMRLGSNLVVDRVRGPESGGAQHGYRAGIRKGDHLLSVNGINVLTRDEAVRELKRQDTAEVELWRPDPMPRAEKPSSAPGKPAAPSPVLAYNPIVALRSLTGDADAVVVPATARGRDAPLAASTASFGPPASCDLLHLVVADPANGCGDPRRELEIRDAAVLVQRGGCRFQDKALNMQWAGAGAVIIAGNRGDALQHLPFSDDGGTAAPITVPTFMVTHEAGEALAARAAKTDASTFVQLLPRDHQCLPAQLAALPSVLRVAETRTGESQRAVVDADGSVTVPEQPDAEKEEESDLLARGGALYVAVDGTLVGQSQLKGALQFPVADPLPPSFAASLPTAFTASASPKPRRAGSAKEASPVRMQTDALRAGFGAGFQGLPASRLVVASPLNACAALENLDDVEGSIVLVARGSCPVSDKARLAQQAGAAAVVLLNNEPGLVSPQGAGASSDLQDITIPVAVVTADAGETLLAIARQAFVYATRMAEAAEVPAAEAGETVEDRRREMARTYLANMGPHAVLFGRQAVADVWTELTSLSNSAAWAPAAEARKKQYRELARRHHPDKDGTTERFAVLKAAHAAADYFLLQREAMEKRSKK